jgi:hypothetical protein
MRRWIKRLAIAAGVLIVLAAAGMAYHRYRYPYGRSHCCDKQLSSVLIQYAEQHDGWFPRGEATPEASLSLLYRWSPDFLDLLPGKTVPVETVRARLASGSLLTPETCGWHYVEGLRIDDDPRLALFWDKVGLGHNGERLPDGGHSVTFIGGSHRVVAGREWDPFLVEQARLLADVKRSE